jgi:hypothetical protein
MVNMQDIAAIVGIDPIVGGPLEDTVLPTTLEDVELQLDVLIGEPDHEYRHMEADRLLLVALAIAGTKLVTMSDIQCVINTFKKVRKVYG